MARRDVDASESDVETRVWERTLERMQDGRTSSAVRWIRVCDRGADIFEVLQKTIEAGLGFVIRACRDRALEAGAGTLFAKVRQSPSVGSMELSLRSRPQHLARTANLAIAAERVCLRSPTRPGRSAGKSPGILCSVIRVWEEQDGIEAPLEWILLCDKEIRDLPEAMTCIQQYASRWLIEDFHKALKTGLQAERLQLEAAHRLFSAVSLMSIVAVRLLALRENFRINPEEPASASGLNSLELRILEACSRRPLHTVADVALAVGRLGGHMNRKSDGMPGLLTLWKGFRRLRDMMEGAHLLQEVYRDREFGE